MFGVFYYRGDMCAMSPLLCLNGVPICFAPYAAFGRLLLCSDRVGMLCGGGRSGMEGVDYLLAFGFPPGALT